MQLTVCVRTKGPRPDSIASGSGASKALLEYTQMASDNLLSFLEVLLCELSCLLCLGCQCLHLLFIKLALHSCHVCHCDAAAGCQGRLARRHLLWGAMQKLVLPGLLVARNVLRIRLGSSITVRDRDLDHQPVAGGLLGYRAHQVLGVRVRLAGLI